MAESQSPISEVQQFLHSGRGALRDAPQQFGRPFGPADYFWMAVCLGALVLANVQQRPNVVGRLEALTDAFGRRGAQPDLEESLHNELAILDGLGLLWPLYTRAQGHWVRDPEVPLAPAFGAGDAYWLSVAHIAAALLVEGGRETEVAEFSQVIGDLVTGGLQPEHEQAILAVIASIRLDQASE